MDETRVMCPSCHRRRGRWRHDRPGLAAQAKCRNCGDEFYRWRGCGWLIPSEVSALKDAIHANHKNKKTSEFLAKLAENKQRRQLETEFPYDA